MQAVMRIADAIQQLAQATKRAYIVLDVDRDSSSSIRIHQEFNAFGKSAVDQICDGEIVIIDYGSDSEACDAFLVLDITFPRPGYTTTSLIAHLIQPDGPIQTITQIPGYAEGRVYHNCTGLYREA